MQFGFQTTYNSVVLFFILWYLFWSIWFFLVTFLFGFFEGLSRWNETRGKFWKTIYLLVYETISSMCHKVLRAAKPQAAVVCHFVYSARPFVQTLHFVFSAHRQQIYSWNLEECGLESLQTHKCLLQIQTKVLWWIKLVVTLCWFMFIAGKSVAMKLWLKCQFPLFLF